MHHNLGTSPRIKQLKGLGNCLGLNIVHSISKLSTFSTGNSWQFMLLELYTATPPPASEDLSFLIKWQPSKLTAMSGISQVNHDSVMQIISGQYRFIRTDKSSNLFCKWHTLVSNTDGKRESSKGTRTRQLSRKPKWQIVNGKFQQLAGQQWLRSVMMVGICVDHCSADRQLVNGTAG